MQDDTQQGLEQAAQAIGDPLSQALVKDVSALVSDAIKEAFDKEDSEGFYEQILKPYVTAYVYHSIATELTRRAEDNKRLVDAAVERRYDR